MLRRRRKILVPRTIRLIILRVVEIHRHIFYSICKLALVHQPLELSIPAEKLNKLAPQHYPLVGPLEGFENSKISAKLQKLPKGKRGQVGLDLFE
jgi:hypothetical protein